MNNESTQLSIVERQLQQIEKGITTIKGDLMQVVNDNKTELYSIMSEGQELIAAIKEHGIDDDLDSQAAEYIKRARGIKKSISDRRKPVTQIFDMVKKGFTQMEAMVDPKTEDSPVHVLQAVRDAYAQRKLMEQRKAEEERQRLMRIKEEKERVSQDVRNVCENIYHSSLTNALNGMQAAFTLMTLDTAEQVKKSLEEWNTDLLLTEQFEKVKPHFWTSEISDVDLAQIIQEGIINVKGELTEQYRNNIDKLRDEYLQYFGSKVKELTEQKRLEDEAHRKAEEAQRIADEDARRKAEEEARKAEEERKEREEAIRLAEEQRQAEYEAQMQQEQMVRDNQQQLEKAQREAEALFNQADTIEEAKVKAKVTRRLVIHSAEGWQDVLSLWVANIAPTLTPDEVTRKLDFMRKDIEKLSNKQDATFSVRGAEWKEEIKAK